MVKWWNRSKLHVLDSVRNIVLALSCLVQCTHMTVAAGTPANASTSNLSPPLPVSRGPAAAPSAAVSLPPALGGLADAAAASLGSTGSHVLLLSVTTVGGFCVIVLLAAAAVFCALRRRRSKRKAYVVERKPSESQASFGGSGRGAVVQPSPHKTTPKGLRQAYAKAAGLYRGSVCCHSWKLLTASLCVLVLLSSLLGNQRLQHLVLVPCMSWLIWCCLADIHLVFPQQCKVTTLSGCIKQGKGQLSAHAGFWLLCLCALSMQGSPSAMRTAIQTYAAGV